MKRVAIIGGGIAGVSAAYQLARLQSEGADLAFTLFERSSRLGGIVETVRRDGFVVECGPDSWVTEKPWARELAVELGLEAEIIHSLDEQRRTWLAIGNTLQPMPDGMRMMVPVAWEGVLASPLFSDQAKQAYLREPQRAVELKASALDANPPRDESVRDFILRHFGAEVTDTIAAPLLAGVFGGDIARMSARAVLPAFVALEREYGSLILGFQHQARRNSAAQPIFSSLRQGLAGLIAAMEQHIPAACIRRNSGVDSLQFRNGRWHLPIAGEEAADPANSFDALILATPADATCRLLAPLHSRIADLLPQCSSSAIVVAMAFTAEQAKSFRIPPGFGFLVPQSGHPASSDSDPQPLACTFVNQKFPHRAPPGSVLLRAFFGGPSAHPSPGQTDQALTHLAHVAMEKFLGELPQPSFALVRHWPNSLPLYEVGHLERLAELRAWAATMPGLHLIGNSYHGVGLPDMIRDGRNAAREIAATLSTPM